MLLSGYADLKDIAVLRCNAHVTQRGDLHFVMPTLDRRRCGRAAGCEGCLGASFSDKTVSINWLSVNVMADRTS